MATVDECPKSPDLVTKGHAWFVDKEDKRFKTCAWCNTTAYRTDEELLKEAGLK